MAALEENATAATVDLMVAEDGGLAPDPMDEIEANLRREIVDTTKSMLIELAAAITPETVSRALRLGENISKHTRKLLAEMGLGNMLDAHPKRRLGGTPNLGDDDIGEFIGSSGGIGNNLETFGAQFIQQLGSSIKTLTNPSKKSGFDGLSLNSLMSAIERAKEMQDNELEQKLRTKLDKLLESEGGEVPTDVVDALPPMSVKDLLPPASEDEPDNPEAAVAQAAVQATQEEVTDAD